jgi:hypothetical protein
MSRKNGNRFCEKEHAQTKSCSGMTFRRKVTPLRHSANLGGRHRRTTRLRHIRDQFAVIILTCRGRYEYEYLFANGNWRAKTPVFPVIFYKVMELPCRIKKSVHVHNCESRLISVILNVAARVFRIANEPGCGMVGAHFPTDRQIERIANRAADSVCLPRRAAEGASSE